MVREQNVNLSNKFTELKEASCLYLFGPGKYFKNRGMVLPFQPLSLSFSNINYYVDVPLVCNWLLHYLGISV